MRAEYEAADDSGHRHAVERPVERSPKPGACEQAIPGPALAVEPVPDVHGTALVVPAEQVNVFRVPSLERQQQSDHLRDAFNVMKYIISSILLHIHAKYNVIIKYNKQHNDKILMNI